MFRIIASSLRLKETLQAVISKINKIEVITQLSHILEPLVEFKSFRSYNKDGAPFIANVFFINLKFK